MLRRIARFVILTPVGLARVLAVLSLFGVIAPAVGVAAAVAVGVILVAVVVAAVPVLALVAVAASELLLYAITLGIRNKARESSLASPDRDVVPVPGPAL